MKRAIFALSICLALGAQSEAANWYVRPSGGSGSGASWTAAWNGFSGINWGSVSAGDTIWVAGGSYGDLYPSKSGTASAWVNIRRARTDSSECTGSAGWSSSYASTITQNQSIIQMGNYNYILISGRTTATGGTQGWHINHSSSPSNHGIYIPNGSTAHHLTFEYINVEGANTYDWGSVSYGNGIHDRAFNEDVATYHTYSHMKIHGWNTLVYVLGSNYHVLEYSELYNCKGDSDHHPNIMYIKHAHDGTIRFNRIYNNEAYGTGIAFSDGENPETKEPTNWFWNRWTINGNVFINNDDASGSVAIAFQRGIMDGAKIYNNTFDDSTFRSSDGSCGPGSYMRNNIWYNSGWFSCGTMSNDLDGPSAGIFVNRTAGDYHIVSTTGSGYPRNAGYTLSADGFLNYDMDGNRRGADGTFDIGAYEYATGGGDVTPPTTRSAAIGAAGTSLTIAISETVAIGSGGNGGVTVSASGGAVTATYSSGSGTADLVYSLSRSVQAGETVTCSYTQPGNGIEDTSGNDLASFSAQTVTNSSTVRTVLSGLSPTGEQACSSNPRSVTISATSDITTRVRYSTIANVAYASMTGTMDTGNATSHSATITGLSCGTSHTFYLKAVNSTSDTLITFTIAPAVTGIPKTLKHGRVKGATLK